MDVPKSSRASGDDFRRTHGPQTAAAEERAIWARMELALGFLRGLFFIAASKLARQIESCRPANSLSPEVVMDAVWLAYFDHAERGMPGVVPPVSAIVETLQSQIRHRIVRDKSNRENRAREDRLINDLIDETTAASFVPCPDDIVRLTQLLATVRADVHWLVTKYRRFANAMARRCCKRLGIDVDDDTKQVALVGLWEAIPRYRATNGTMFTTYAQSAVDKRVIDWNRTKRGVSIGAARDRAAYQRKRQELSEIGACNPTPSQVMNKLGWGSRKRQSFARSLAIEKAASLDSRNRGEASAKNVQETINPWAEIQREEEADRLRVVLAQFSPNDRWLVHLKYIEERPWREVADLLQINVAEAYRRDRRIRRKLKQLLSDPDTRRSKHRTKKRKQDNDNAQSED